MEKRVLLAIVLCIIVLVLWEKFFVPKRQPAPPSTSPAVEQVPPAPTKPDQAKPTVPKIPTSEAPAPSTLRCLRKPARGLRVLFLNAIGKP